MPIHYTDPNADVPPGVDFHDIEQVRAWVAACEVDKPWRVPMRQRFAELIDTLSSGSRVLELGCGPGYLAECILEHCPDVKSYTVVDFSEHMLNLTRERIGRFKKAEFVRADFKSEDWIQAVTPPYSAVISMQAVHEVRHKRHIPSLYRQVRDLIEPNGLFAVCEGIPQESSALWKLSLTMTVDEQLATLASSGFSKPTVDKSIDAMILVTGRRP